MNEWVYFAHLRLWRYCNFRPPARPHKNFLTLLMYENLPRIRRWLHAGGLAFLAKRAGLMVSKCGGANLCWLQWTRAKQATVRLLLMWRTTDDRWQPESTGPVNSGRSHSCLKDPAYTPLKSTSLTWTFQVQLVLQAVLHAGIGTILWCCIETINVLDGPVWLHVWKFCNLHCVAFFVLSFFQSQIFWPCYLVRHLPVRAILPCHCCVLLALSVRVAAHFTLHC